MPVPLEKIPNRGTFVIVYRTPNIYAAHWDEKNQFNAPREDFVTVTKSRKNEAVHVAYGKGSGADYPSVADYRKALALIRAEVQSILLDDGTIISDADAQHSSDR